MQARFAHIIISHTYCTNHKIPINVWTSGSCSVHCTYIHTYTSCAYVTRYGKTDLSRFFMKIAFFMGIDQRRIYCRVQRSRSQALKTFLSQVMAKKLYTGHPCLSSQFFEKRSVLYVHNSTFNVSVYTLCYTMRLAP